VFGTSVHGLFASDPLRAAWLERLDPARRSRLRFDAELEETLDELAAALESALDLDALLAVARGG
jgi:adenosylcobyric acid synthase